METAPSIEKARKEYRFTDQAGKTLLEKLWTKEELQVKPESDFPSVFETFKQIQVNDAWLKSLQGRQPETLFAYERLCIRAHVMRSGWVPDYSNDERKWFPYFEWNESVAGFVFSGTSYGRRFTFTNGGPRLAQQSSELAKQLWQDAEEDWSEFLNFKS